MLGSLGSIMAGVRKGLYRGGSTSSRPNYGVVPRHDHEVGRGRAKPQARGTIRAGPGAREPFVEIKAETP